MRETRRHLLGRDDDIEQHRDRTRFRDEIGRSAPEQWLRHGLQRVAFESE
jgi:hypothetical protein